MRRSYTYAGCVAASRLCRPSVTPSKHCRGMGVSVQSTSATVQLHAWIALPFVGCPLKILTHTTARTEDEGEKSENQRNRKVNFGINLGRSLQRFDTGTEEIGPRGGRPGAYGARALASWSNLLGACVKPLQ